MVIAISLRHSLCFMTYQTSTESKQNIKCCLRVSKTLECDQPCKKTKQNVRGNTSDEVMQSGFVWLFPIVTNTGLFLEASQKTFKGITSPSLFEWSYIFPFLSTLGIPVVSFSSREARQVSPQNFWTLRVCPKAPERKVGISLCWQHRVSVFSPHPSCHGVSEWQYPPHGVTNLNTKHKKKKEYGRNGWLGLVSQLWCGESELPDRGLIVIVGFEVGEVCVGIGLPGKLWVEVLISFLQNQIVFVEGLWGETRGSQYG